MLAMFNLIPSLFPQILFLAPFSALMMRMAIGFIIGSAGWSRISAARTPLYRILALLEILVAIAVVLGVYTQASALVAAAILCAWLARPRISSYPSSTIALALIMAVSLIITGPGPFGIDFPF
jgi:uncharacterized membrane protein YphA (DoxX/SURF4 family)